LGQYIGREKFDDYEADLHKCIKYFNVRGTSETLRHPSDEEEKVRSVLKDAEQGRNDLVRQENLFS
jgi:hypothetical protein